MTPEQILAAVPDVVLPECIDEMSPDTFIEAYSDGWQQWRNGFGFRWIPSTLEN